MDSSKIFSLSAHPEEARNDWERFTAAYQEACGPLPRDSKWLLKLARLFGNSRFLTRYVIARPILAKKKIPFPSSRSGNLKEWLKAVRLHKYSELLRITLSDLEGQKQESVLKELSDLALRILKNVDRRVALEGKQKWGAYHLIALGKLGGRELNYSSDIDLLPVLAQDKPSARELFSRHAQAVAGALQTVTEEGFLYRVDWDLRPEGKGGSLVNTLASLESYYESFGSDWERQALTKASPGAGDTKVFKNFARKITPFVYRKSLDHENIAGILSMKQKIHENLEGKGDGFNIKLGIGGIREIEFFVQAFLLIFGGRDPSIRGTGTLPVLRQLARKRYLPLETAKDLADDYLFLRKLEHRLQLVDEAQTHTLQPGEKAALEAARLMGYQEPDPAYAASRFQADLARTTERVNAAFTRLFSEPHAASRPIPSPYSALCSRLEKLETMEQKLNEIRIYKKEETAPILKMEDRPGVSRQEILRRLSVLAEGIAQVGLSLARQVLTPIYGTPMTNKDGVETKAHLVTVGMGKLGGNEINYFSDLDLIFIFSGHGETTGPRKISNMEFFSRLVQKFISILSVPTWTGAAYSVDCELRPSGHAGPLVTTLENFLDYQREVSQIWERQALTKSRVLAGSAYFAGLVATQIAGLLYSAPYPDSIGKEMHRLRLRVEKEVAQETSRMCDFKGGRGAMMDIEFILQFLQLRHGHSHPTLQTTSTFEGLDAAIALNLFPSEEDGVLLKEAYTYYRTLESRLTLAAGRGIRKTEPNPEYLDYSSRVRAVYGRIFL
ncbi:MAG: hypothetical protein Q7T11_09760 [Deltaproteobacteria bacterium]|nr:hypothetical protein [Deltaproteobacteria bacterium]